MLANLQPFYIVTRHKYSFKVQKLINGLNGFPRSYGDGRYFLNGKEVFVYSVPANISAFTKIKQELQRVEKVINFNIKLKQNLENSINNYTFFTHSK